MRKSHKMFYGWWMVLAAAIQNVFSGGAFFYGFTAFFNPIRETFHWNSTVTSIAFSFQRLESGIAGPIAGFLVDRTGPRKLMVFGWAVMGLGYILMSRINTLWTFYATYIIIAIGLSFGSFVVTNTAIAHWFNKKRSRALSYIYLGYGASGALVPLLSISIAERGWRDTLFLLGWVLGAIGIGLSLVMRDKPQPYGYLPDGEKFPNSNGPARLAGQPAISTSADYQPEGMTAREALKTPAFWLLGLVFLFQQMGTSAVVVHNMPYLESVGISRTVAAFVVTGITVCSLIGRFGFGFWGDYAEKRYLIALSLSLQAIGLLIFAFVTKETAWLIIPFLLTYAPGYGGPIPLRPGLQADYFGTRSFGTIMGLMASITMLGGLVSPVFSGWVFDTIGSYRNVWLIFAGTTVPAVILALVIRPPRINIR